MKFFFNRLFMVARHYDTYLIAMRSTERVNDNKLVEYVGFGLEQTVQEPQHKQQHDKDKVGGHQVHCFTHFMAVGF